MHGTARSEQSSPLHPLVAQLTQAARDGDQAKFDQLFDCCFDWVYAIAWQATRDQRRSEAITAHVLSDAVARATCRN
jgi:hypothetical protein